MADLDGEILRWNPWWRNRNAIEADPHIRAFESAPVQWVPPILSHLRLTSGDTHTVRGPRQAGKTTLAKLLIRQLLERGESRVFFFSFDLHRDPETLLLAIRRAKEIHPDPEGLWYLFLDEVSSVPDWQRGIKVAWDQGLTREDALLLTGSSAHDIRIGSEQLPGRRGVGMDFLHLPMSFRDFCIQVERLGLPAESADVDALLSPNGRKLARSLYLFLPELNRAFINYLTVGGFPAAIGDYRRSGQPLPGTIRMLWDTIAGDVAKTGRDQIAALKLLEEINVSLGNPLKWEGAAKAMGMAAGATAREYVEYLSESFALLTVFFWDMSGRSLQPSKQRKVYFADSLMAQIAPQLMPGARAPGEDALVENMAALGLFRSSAFSLTQAAPAPGAVGYWRSTGDREIDFVVPSNRGRNGRLPVEVKGDSRTAISHARLAITRSFGEGLVLSRTVFEPEGEVPVLPVSVFLAALTESPERTSGIA